MKENYGKRAKFEIDRTSFLAEAAIILMLLSAVFRLIGSWGLWGDEFFVATQIILPICCCVGYALFLFLFGKRVFWLTTLPVLLGVIFFILKSLGFDSVIHTLLCILLYMAVAVIYTATAFGLIRTKWLLPPLFGLPLLYHIFVEDLAAMRDTANPVTFTDGMMEMSVLCVMAALLCVGLGLKKRKSAEEKELPKIKDPVVLAPKAPEQPEEQSAAADTAGAETAVASSAPAEESAPNESAVPAQTETAGAGARE